MTKILKKILIVLFAFILFGCVDVIDSSFVSESTTPTINLEEAKNNFLELLPSTLSEDFIIPNLEDYENIEITFVSDNLKVLTNEGKFTKPINETTLNLEFTFKYNDDELVFDVKFTIPGYTAIERVNEALLEIELPNEVGDDLTLTNEVSKYGVNVTWVSSNEDVITALGKYTKPENDTEVTLTATLTYEDEELEHDFVVTALGLTGQDKVELAKEELLLEIETTKVDFTLPVTGKYNTTITWESKNKTFLTIDEDKALVVRPHELFDDETVVLVATIKLGDATAIKEFEVVVESYKVVDAIFMSPNKYVYFVNDKVIDLEGGSVTITLDDLTQKTVPLTLDMVERFDSSQVGEYEIELSYFGFVFSYKVHFINSVTNKRLEVNESVFETFDDMYNPKLSFDFAQVPDSKIIFDERAIENNSLYFASEGSFKTLFINGGVEFVAKATYRVSFDYKLLSKVDTIYFQFLSPVGNQFTQFGGNVSPDEIRHFEYLVTLGDSTDYLIQIFPGGGVGLTSLIIDNFKIERIVPENNVTVDGKIEVGEYILETFGDASNKIFDLDLTPTPKSTLTSDPSKAIEGTSLYFSSNGDFTGIYIKNAGLFSPNAKYRVTFDYKLLSINNTIYFQFTSSAGNVFTEINGIEPSDEVHLFDYTFTLGPGQDYMIQIFPGGGNGLTELVIDNLKIERLSVEEVIEENNHYVSGELNEGNYVLETFGDPEYAIFGLDKADATLFEIVDDGIFGKSLYFVSSGLYRGGYLNNASITYTPSAVYLVEFDYIVIKMADTIYFQFTSSNGSANVFAQFGSLENIGVKQRFSQIMTLKDVTDYVIKIFPGAAEGELEVIINNLKITRMIPNINSAEPLEVNELVRETFDGENFILNVDTAPTPDSKIINDGNGIVGTSLLLDSSGNFNGFYLTNSNIYSSDAVYRVSFDYKVVSIDGALYIKVYSDDVVDAQIPVISDNLVHNYSFEFSIDVSGNAVIHIFPNSPCKIYIDNIVIERIS